jgi:hypothetical protein
MRLFAKQKKDSHQDRRRSKANVGEGAAGAEIAAAKRKGEMSNGRFFLPPPLLMKLIIGAEQKE